MNVTEVLNIKSYTKYGYEIRTEMWELVEGEEPSETTAAYNLNGIYIGNEKSAKVICKKNGIIPEPARDGDGICTVGFCANELKYYGWSHRAMYGFKIGDIVEEGDATDESLPIGFTANTMADARCMAVAFADSVG
jgi:hypothetical protein